MRSSASTRSWKSARASPQCARQISCWTRPAARCRQRYVQFAVSSAFGRELSLRSDPSPRLVGSLAVNVPELLEIRSIKICEFLTGIGERGVEFAGLDRLADGGAQRRYDFARRAARCEYAKPKIIFDVKSKLFERRHVGQGLRAGRAEGRERAQLPRFDVR